MIKKIVVISWIVCSGILQACVPTCIQQGPNHSQPAPILISAVNTNGVITVNGKLSSIRKDATYIIQFFGNPTANASITQGRDFLGQAAVTSDCFGNAVFSAILLPPTQNTDPFISATATLVLCTGQTSDTSEFSVSIPVTIS